MSVKNRVEKIIASDLTITNVGNRKLDVSGSNSLGRVIFLVLYASKLRETITPLKRSGRKITVRACLT